MLLALMSGQIDAMTWTIPYATVENMKKVPSPAIHIVELVETGARYLIFQCKHYPTNQTWFRQVVAYILNVTDVVKTVYLGYADEGNMGRVSPALTKWYNPDTTYSKMYPYNLTKAAQLLDEHNFKDIDGDGWREDDQGNKLVLTLYSPSYDPQRVRWGEMIKDGLANVGIQVDYHPLEWTMLVNYLNSGTFDMLIIGGVGSLDPDLLYSLYHSEGGWNINNANYANPDLDKLLEQQRATTDEEERIALIKQIQVEIAKEIPLLNVVHQHFIYAYRDDKIAGWITSPFLGPDNFFSFMNIYDVALSQQQPPPQGGEEVKEVIPPWVYALIVITVIAVICALGLAYKYQKKRGE
jgi:peptide/nickel transport system substrate-binding protein